MAKRCTKCGNFLMDEERFCTRCGENVADIQPTSSQYVSSAPQTPAQQPGPNQNYGGTQNQYNYPPYAVPVRNYDEMTLGKWVGTIIVTTFFGIISLVFLFVWGFGDGPESRKNYCKAMLIVEAISIGVGILIWIILMGMIGSMGAAFSGIIEEYAHEYGQGTAAIMQMFGM